ncbi:hypothetical protein CBW65_09935 [Tumebacillus avium]|uniref:DUF4367 domain-containing protein n=1 Tax=Tumebacillus avium TaxID=1903704 RepID=A0A1Y0IL87_9BACL|nr:DUF4367 domain-containing protein [Tumebacillus avium]ARU61277.1 hypothetical protein CBW65_09935 [Tumebacillus avium]
MRSIISKSAPSEQKQTPIQAAIHQTEWEFSDSTKRAPTEQDAEWATTFLQNGVVALKVPVADPCYTFLFLTHNGEQWSIAGLADIHIKKAGMLSDKEGLDLPMEQFVVSKLSVNTEDNQAWVFADDKKQIVIGKYPHSTAFSALKNAKVVQMNGIDAWYVKQDTGTLFYYIDQGHVVWIAGNLSERELQSLAASLPNAAVYSFPFAKPKGS